MSLGSETMIKLSRRQIAGNCVNPNVFTRGQQYYRRGAVRKVDFEGPGRVVARVQGRKKYTVDIVKEEEEILFHCTCAAFAAYDGFCKHIVAVLLALQDREPVSGIDSTERTLVNHLLDWYSGPAAGSGSEVELDLFVQVHNNTGSNSPPPVSVSLKAGEKGARQYVVRDVDKFMAAVAQREPFIFGKQFTYNPPGHSFAPDSRGLLDFFIRIHEIEKSYGYYGPPGLLKGKEIKLPPHLLRRLLDQLGEKAFTLQVGKETFTGARAAAAGPLLQFQLQESEKGLALKLEDADEIELLTAEGDLLLHGAQLYNLAGTEQAALLPLLCAIKKQRSSALPISAAQEQRFFSGLYPLIEKTAALKITPALQKRLYRPPLETNIYLDYDGGRVVARLEYIYGEIKLNPFDPLPAGQPGPGKERLLIRDSAAEHEVMRFFEEAAFTVSGGAMHLEEEEQIWPFIYETIPLLQQHAAIYYSERFKQAGRKAPRFTGKAGIDWNLDLLELELGLEDVNPEELAEIWQSLRIKRRYHRLRDGSILPLEGEGVEQFNRLAGALDLQPSDLKQRTVHLPKHQALYLDGLIREYDIAPVTESEDLAGLVRHIRNPAGTDYPLPLPLQGVLRGYQETGYKWLKSLAACGFGGILADDMGLGKTVQAIAFILSERQENPAQLPVLVVTPASLIYNWEAEIEKFAPQLKVLVIAGTKKERRELLSGTVKADVIITSYPLLRRDISDYAPLQFSSCFLDEAQYIKNPNSLTAQCARKIKTSRRFALTGTPMENSLIELWSIFQFIMPGYLQSQKKFTQRYCSAAAAAEPGFLPENGFLPLAVKVRPFILRRLKEEVLTELPPKIEHRYLSELTADQKKLYLAYLERLRSETAESLQNSDFNRSRIQILAGLMRLRQICCHPSLFLENYNGESAKLLQLQELLREAVDGGHRILLFSQFTGMLRLIKKALDREGYHYFYLDGATKTGERLQMVNAFNMGEGEMFLISLRAGGTGLNLTGADIVVQFDLWWNPAVEEQAAGRAHRIGQKKVVQVIRLLAKGTIEEKIFELQQKKKELVDRVVQPGETFLSSMDESDIREILEL